MISLMNRALVSFSFFIEGVKLPNIDTWYLRKPVKKAGIKPG